MAFTGYEFDIMKQELLVGFDELTEDFDRVFIDDSNELEFSESYMGIRSENVREELIILHRSYSLNPRSNKIQGKIKPERVSNLRMYKDVIDQSCITTPY
jgi:hypothetical protein